MERKTVLYFDFMLVILFSGWLERKLLKTNYCYVITPFLFRIKSPSGVAVVMLCSNNLVTMTSAWRWMMMGHQWPVVSHTLYGFHQKWGIKNNYYKLWDHVLFVCWVINVPTNGEIGGVVVGGGGHERVQVPPTLRNNRQLHRIRGCNQKHWVEVLIFLEFCGWKKNVKWGGVGLLETLVYGAGMQSSSVEDVSESKLYGGRVLWRHCWYKWNLNVNC